MTSALASLAAATALIVGLFALYPSSAAGTADTAPAAGEAEMEPQLVRQFEQSGGEPQEFWVRFDTRADLSAAAEITDWTERGEYVVRTLQEAADKAQAETIDLLESRGVSYEAFWVANQILVHDGDHALAEQLAQRPEVDRLTAPRSYSLPHEPIEKLPDEAIAPSATQVSWGVTNINADDVWDLGFDGDGIVVANIDTGVRYDHVTLVDQYRGNNGNGSFTHDYNWFDASGACDGAPCDTNGHGTHTMGTMAGDDPNNQLLFGVAPDVTWIAANGCHTCTATDLMASAQWMLAPTRLDGSDADPAMRPHIINNSWGSTSPSNDPWFDDMAAAWEAAGIFVAWSNGNIGPACQTSGSPGSGTLNYSVGAYDESNTIASFSSRGPGQDGQVKPNIAAPGVDIVSAHPGGFVGIGSGTSMAAPHLAGAVALLWSAAPDLVGDITATRALLDTTAVDTENTQCGGDAEKNNVFGEGRLDVLPLVEGRRVGFLTGTVTDQVTGEPVPGATVRIVGGSSDRPIDRTVRSDDDGVYHTALPSGAYRATASSYGYLEQSADVTLTEDVTTTQDFALGLAPLATVSGVVTDDSGHGWPLYAEVTVTGAPVPPVFTDPTTGRYTVELPTSADYTVVVDPVYDGYPTVSDMIELEEAGVELDHPVPADLETCVAPGYGWNGRTTTFNGWAGVTPQSGWEISGASGSWRFDNPQHRQQPRSADGAFPLADPAADPKGRLDTTLTSPPFDLTGQDAPQLMLDMRYLGARRQSGRIEYSTDGREWATVWSGTSDHTIGLRTYSLPDAADQASVQVRFTFTGRGTTYWGFDNLFVGTRECLPLEGGLIVGDVSDGATHRPVPGATVHLGSAPESIARSQGTDDPARTGAPYWLFAPGSGGDQLRAERYAYVPFTADVAIRPHEVIRHDIELHPSPTS